VPDGRFPPRAAALAARPIGRTVIGGRDPRPTERIEPRRRLGPAIDRIGRSGRGLGREGPAALAAEAVIAHLGAVAARVDEAELLAVGVVGVGRLGALERGPDAFLRLGEAAGGAKLAPVRL